MLNGYHYMLRIYTECYTECFCLLSILLAKHQQVSRTPKLYEHCQPDIKIVSVGYKNITWYLILKYFAENLKFIVKLQFFMQN